MPQPVASAVDAGQLPPAAQAARSGEMRLILRQQTMRNPPSRLSLAQRVWLESFLRGQAIERLAEKTDKNLPRLALRQGDFFVSTLHEKCKRHRSLKLNRRTFGERLLKHLPWSESDQPAHIGHHRKRMLLGDRGRLRDG